jgi:hypothetical protein
MFTARADVEWGSDASRAESEAGTDFAYESCHLAATPRER